jgi:SAM-dependent methyltransferase
MNVTLPDDRSSRDGPPELRFEFGRNWSRYLAHVNGARLETARESLRRMLRVETLAGQRFLDVGSGSGLFSLAARQEGATVYSFDFDPDSVACTRELKRRYFDGDPAWIIEQGSVLDSEYLSRLGRFDIVYSWGVLHHTGAMWRALENVVPLVNDCGKLFVAIYNDQGRTSRRWEALKRLYNVLPTPLRPLVLVPAFARFWGPTLLRDLLRGKPGGSWRAYGRSARGMSPWHDVVDWVGGYPFEVAKPEEILAFFREKGFALDQLTTCGGGLGCNEFVFIRGTGHQG